MTEQMTALAENYPAAAELLRRHGGETLLTYLGQLHHRPLPDILPSEDLLTEVRDYFTPFFGAETAGECADVLRRRRCLSTANHHHPAFEYMTVQDTILCDRWLRLQGETGAVVPFLSCANPRLDNNVYPRGMLVYDCTAPEGCLRLPFYPFKLRHACVAAVEGISPDMVDNALNRLRQETRRGSCSLRTADALERFCRGGGEGDLAAAFFGFWGRPHHTSLLRGVVDLVIDLLSGRVQRCGTLREQTTVINAMLSQRYFTDRAPQYLWMPMETLTARLLERDLRTEDALTCQMLFRQELRASLLRELNGVSGCWTGDTSGTHFFWGLDRRAALFPLRLRESAGSAALTGQNSLGEAVTVPLTPQALTEGLRDGSLLPGLFLCFLEAHFLRDFTVFGGFYQPTYLAEMRRGLVRALRETGGYEEEAAIIEAKRSAMTLGLLYLLRSREGGRFPVSTAELLEEPVSMLEVEASLQVSVAAALEHLN